MGDSDQVEVLKLLVAENYLSKDDARAAMAQSPLRPLDFLISQALITEELIGQALAESHGVSYVDTKMHIPDAQMVKGLPEEFAERNRAVIYDIKADTVYVASDKPDQADLLPELTSILAPRKVNLGYALPHYIDEILLLYRDSLETRFSTILQSSTAVASEIVEAIIDDALAYEASDIHLEPSIDMVRVRFRLDGVLHEAGDFDKQFWEVVLNRIKVLANMRIDSHDALQDGAVRYDSDEHGQVNIRVSIAPALDGETVVMRLLTEKNEFFTLADLGLSQDMRTQLQKVADRPFGMIVVTGPTGAGKTTTLYSILKYLSTPRKNITTIEDPVEYRLRGINQIQVNPDANITFANGLRSLARQDPDVILVGEIRDSETAQIAVNAALTGHLVLTTFHANDAATAIPRLFDMGIEPFILASTLQMVLSQRLIRKIDTSARTSYEVERSKLSSIVPKPERYFDDKKITLYQGKASEDGRDGYRGRVGVFESLQVSAKMRELLLKKPSRDEIWKQARVEGAVSMFEDGIAKVREGLTTIEELVRVVPAED